MHNQDVLCHSGLFERCGANLMFVSVYTVHEGLVCRQVVICGAVPSMVRSVRLYNDCSSNNVRVDMKGRVLADDDKSERFRKSVYLHLLSLKILN